MGTNWKQPKILGNQLGFHSKMRVDLPLTRPTVSPPFQVMSTTETKQQTLTPAEIPFTTPEVMRHYVTDTGKILPRKYTHLTAKHQRAITKTIKHSRNMLLAK
jgi:small subunit ribosomal protein S18